MARPAKTRLIGGRYRPLRLLGRGGMSEVWLAHDERLGREVALKFVSGSELPGDFEREMGILAGLRHRNIVTVYDAGEDDARRYIVMERVDGKSLREKLQADGPLTAAEAARYGAAVSAALAYAHTRGVLHNDVKPENVLIDGDGEALLTDFGAATITGATVDVAGAAQVMGTIAYVAPEVLQGAPPTPASDIYALSTTLYESMAGRLPYDGRSNAALAGQKVSQPPAQLASVMPGVPPVLESFVSRGLSLSPAERPDATAFHRALSPAAEKARAGAGAVAPAAVGTASRTRPTQRLAAVGTANGGSGGRRGLLVLAGLLGAGLVAAGALALNDNDDPDSTPENGSEQPELAATTPEATPTPTSPPPPTADQRRDENEGRGNDGGEGNSGNGNRNNGNDDDDDEDDDD